MASSSVDSGEAYNHEGRLVGVAAAFLFLETVFFVARAFARRLQKTRMLWQDGCMAVAYISSMGLCAISIAIVRYGAASRSFGAMTTLKSQMTPPLDKTTTIAFPAMYFVAVASPKLAILDIYLHIFIARWQRICCWVVAVAITLNMLINISTSIWQCSPISHSLDQTAPDGRCSKIPEHYFLASIPNIVTDIIMLIIPLPAVWTLHTSRRMKCGLIAIFLTGSIGLVTSIVRFIEFHRGYTDETVTFGEMGIWTTVEPGMYLLAACFLTYQPLVRYLASESFLSSWFGKFRSLLGKKAMARTEGQAEEDGRRPSNGRPSGREDVKIKHGQAEDGNIQGCRAKPGEPCDGVRIELVEHQV